MIKLTDFAADGDSFEAAVPFVSDGNLPMIHRQLCKGCGLCVEHCPASLLKIGTTLNALGYAPVEVGQGECLGCAVCFYTCPEPGAISVRRLRKAAKRENYAKIS